MPAGNWRTLDFGEGDPTSGIEVVEFLEPVMKSVDLMGRNLTYSS